MININPLKVSFAVTPSASVSNMAAMKGNSKHSLNILFVAISNR